MDICQLKYFISAASIGNFTLAALENNISQSSFSKQIMNLENELGMKLFIREARNIELTPAGEQFQEYAQRMLSIYTEMLRGMESYSTFQALPVSIASIPVLQSYALNSLFWELKRRYPKILFSVAERAESTEVMHLLHKGECDFAILRMDFLEKEKYDIYPIVKDRLVVILPETHPLANRDRIALYELKDMQFVMPPERTDLRTIAYNACITAGFRPELAYITSGNIELTLDIVEHQGVAYFAFEKVISYYMKNRKKSRIVPLEESIESYTAFVSIKARGMTRARKKIAEFLAQEYGQNDLENPKEKTE